MLDAHIFNDSLSVNQVTSVSVRAVIRKNGLLLVEQPESATAFELPGGALESEGDMKKCLERNLATELKGASFEVGQYLGRVLHIFQDGLGLNSVLNHFFEVIISEGDPVHREPDHIIRWLPISSNELSEIKPPILKKLLLGFDPDLWDYTDAEI